ncbi:MAG: hypothetical protein ACM358_14065 [Gemmatimonadota bacterium]
MPRRTGRGLYLKRLRDAAFAQGLCYECTARPVLFGRRRCEGCNEKNRARLRAKFSAGECRGLCGAQAVPGRSRCDVCREKQREYMRQRRIAAGKKPRQPKTLSTSALPSMSPHLPVSTDGPGKGDSARSAEVDLSQRRAIIAALAARRAA